MRGINSIKHAEFMHMLYTLEQLYREEHDDMDMDGLQARRKVLDKMYLAYCEKLGDLMALIDEYQHVVHATKKEFVAKPYRKLKLDKRQVEKHREIVSIVNLLS